MQPATVGANRRVRPAPIARQPQASKGEHDGSPLRAQHAYVTPGRALRGGARVFAVYHCATSIFGQPPRPEGIGLRAVTRIAVGSVAQCEPREGVRQMAGNRLTEAKTYGMIFRKGALVMSAGTDMPSRTGTRQSSVFLAARA